LFFEQAAEVAGNGITSVLLEASGYFNFRRDELSIFYRIFNKVGRL
jgi:hypothetical protein